MMWKSFVLDMTWEEFRDAVDEKTVIVIPLGSMELEGTHLPLGVDTIVADGVAERLGGLENIFIAPSLPIGYSKWFTQFPGTISLEHDTLTSVLHEYSMSLVRHRVKRLVFLNGHRGNNSSVEVVARTLTHDHQVRVGMINIFKLANDLITGGDLISEGKFTHGGEIMTALIMALKPEAVVTSKIRPDSVQSPEGTAFQVKNSLGETAFQGSIQMVYQDTRDVTGTGIMGDPTGATAEKGEKLLNMITDYVRDYLMEFQKLPITARKD